MASALLSSSTGRLLDCPLLTLAGSIRVTASTQLDQVARLWPIPRTITIPPLACSQPLRAHASYPRIRQQADAWLLSVLRPSSQEEANALQQSLFPFLACATHVDVSEKLCLVAAKLMAWSFLFDDTADDVRAGWGSKQPVAQILMEEFDDSMLLAPAPVERKSSLSQHLLAAANTIDHRHHRAAAVDVELGWWKEMRAILSPAYQNRFHQNCRRYCAAATAQVALREAGILPDLHSYILRRRKVACVYGFFTLLESGLGVEFDERVLDCELLMNLRDAVSDHVAWVNDLFSFKKEYVDGGDCHNLLAVVWHQQLTRAAHRRSLQESVDIVSQMIKQREDDIGRLLNEARGSKMLMEKPGIEKYLQGIADWLPANLHFSYNSARYFSDLYLAKSRCVHTPVVIHL